MNQLFLHDGKRQTLKAISDATGIGYSILRNRVLIRRWSLKQALSVPVRAMGFPVDGLKKCTACQQEKPLNQFHQQRHAGKTRYGYCLECTNQKNTARADGRRQRCIAHYSNGANKCSLCPESRIWVLDLDHINGRSPGERKTQTRSLHMTRELIRRKFPKGFRVLCRNCNWMEHLRRNRCGPFRVYAPTQ